jgi:hypothetical protein
VPPRWLTVIILGFWVCTSGWLVYQEAGPLVQPPGAPPYFIDLVDEVQYQQAHARWVVAYNGRPLRAETWIEYDPADDTFALTATLYPRAAPSGEPGDDGQVLGNRKVRSATSTHRVSRRGALRAIASHFEVVDTDGRLVKGSFDGAVRDGLFTSRLSLTDPAARECDSQPVAVSGGACVLEPLHPAHRIAGLRPGQSWRLPLLDPIKDALAASAPGAAPGREVVVTAHVLPETRPLTWNGREAPCLVVEYEGERVAARTWVEAATGLVLLQEAEYDDYKLTMRRE